MDTTAMTALPPNTLGTNAFLFLAGTWTVVLSLMLWSFRKLMTTKADEPLPPPGSIP